MKTLDTLGSVAALVLVPLCGTVPLACSGDDSNSGTSNDTQSTGGAGSPVPADWGTGGSAFTPGGGGMGMIAPSGVAGTSPDYQEIPFTRCVPEFCQPVAGAQACCLSPDGPCGADYGNGCQSPEPQWGGNGGFGNGPSGTGGFGIGGFPWWSGTGGSASGGTASAGTGGAPEPDPVDASPNPSDAGSSGGTASDASSDAASD